MQWHTTHMYAVQYRENLLHSYASRISASSRISQPLFTSFSLLFRRCYSNVVTSAQACRVTKGMMWQSKSRDVVDIRLVMLLFAITSSTYIALAASAKASYMPAAFEPNTYRILDKQGRICASFTIAVRIVITFTNGYHRGEDNIAAQIVNLPPFIAGENVSLAGSQCPTQIHPNSPYISVLQLSFSNGLMFKMKCVTYNLFNSHDYRYPDPRIYAQPWYVDDIRFHYSLGSGSPFPGSSPVGNYDVFVKPSQLEINSSSGFPYRCDSEWELALEFANKTTVFSPCTLLYKDVFLNPFNSSTKPVHQCLSDREVPGGTPTKGPSKGGFKLSYLYYSIPPVAVVLIAAVVIGFFYGKNKRRSTVVFTHQINDVPTVASPSPSVQFNQ